jgi:urease accessory protein
VIARASLTVEVVDGRSRATELRSDPPLSLRETPTGVHLVASGAGPVGGDDLALVVRLGPGATLDLRSVAASMAHPGPSGRPSNLLVEVDVGEGAHLRWTPEPTILVRGCDHRVTTRIALGRAASLVWRDELVLGRHDEEPGSVLQRLRVDGPTGPVLRTDVVVGPRWPGSLGPGGTGAVRGIGSLLAVSADASALLDVRPDGGTDADRRGIAAGDRAGARWAATSLAHDDAVLVTAVGTTAASVRDRLDGLAAGIAAPPVTPVTTP